MDRTVRQTWRSKENLIEESRAAANESSSVEFDEDKSQNYDLIGLSFLITISWYPAHYLSLKATETMQAMMYSIIESIPKNHFKPEFTTNFWERGYWRIEARNLRSRNWLLKHLKIYENTLPDLIAIHPNHLPTIKYETKLTTDFLSEDLILIQLNKATNAEKLKLSFWNIEKDGLKVTFQVDALSRKFIEEQNCVLSFGSEEITLKAMDFEKIDQMKGVVITSPVYIEKSEEEDSRIRQMHDQKDV